MTKFKVGDKVKLLRSTAYFPEQIYKHTMTVIEVVHPDSKEEYVYVIWTGRSPDVAKYGIYVNDLYKVSGKSIMEILNNEI